MSIVNFEEVFHPSDFTQGDAGAFAHALRIALATKGRLNLLHVHRPNEEVNWSDFPGVRKVLADWNLIPEGAPHDALEELGLSIKKVQRQGTDPVKAIAGYCIEHTPDLLVLATHQRQGLDRLLHPSLAEATAQRSRVMTLFVPRQVPGFVSLESGRVSLKNILVPVDHSPNPQRAADAALSLARTLSVNEAHFTFLYIGTVGDEPALDLPQRPGWTYERGVWSGNVLDHILSTSEAQNCSLIVMATRGRDGVFDALRGSTTERVLRSAKCPVLAVPEMP